VGVEGVDEGVTAELADRDEAKGIDKADIDDEDEEEEVWTNAVFCVPYLDKNSLVLCLSWW